MASVEFHDAASNLSTTLLGVSGSLPAGKVSLRDLLELIGEQGMLLVCVFPTLPFLLPVSIPGVSTVFGLAIILIGVGVTLNRVPWLPRRILDRPLSTAPIKQAFDKVPVSSLVSSGWCVLAGSSSRGPWPDISCTG